MMTLRLMMHAQWTPHVDFQMITMDIAYKGVAVFGEIFSSQQELPLGFDEGERQVDTQTLIVATQESEVKYLNELYKGDDKNIFLLWIDTSQAKPEKEKIPIVSMKQITETKGQLNLDALATQPDVMDGSLPPYQINHEDIVTVASSKPTQPKPRSLWKRIFG